MTKKTTPQSKSFPTSVNSQITDSVTQVNTEILGDTPAISLGNLMQATTQALQNAAHNATTGQQNPEITSQEAITQSVGTLYSIDTANTGAAINKILKDTK